MRRLQAMMPILARYNERDRILSTSDSPCAASPKTEPLSKADPELRPALAQLPNFDTLSADSLAGFRALMSEAPQATEDDVQVDVSRVEVAGGVSALLYRPTSIAADHRRPAMLNIHGGGFVMGTAIREDAAMRALCARHGMVILSVDYRLSPEAPFPAPLDDCIAAFDWFAEFAETPGTISGRIGVRGVSAGGGLAAGLALRLRDRGGAMPAWLWLLYPMLDDRTAGAPGTGAFVWTRAANRFGWASYLGCTPGSAEISAYAAPARADNLAGLPPTFMATGSIDLFAGEDIDFAARLHQSGVPVELHVYPGAYHGFNLIADARVARRYHADADAAVSRFIDFLP